MKILLVETINENDGDWRTQHEEVTMVSVEMTEPVAATPKTLCVRSVNINWFFGLTREN